MKIGIDIDDTTFNTAKKMIQYGDIFEEKRTGKKLNRDGFGLIKNRYYLKILYGWDDETKFSFFNEYYKNILEECEVLPDAPEVVKKLKEDGNYIHFVTARLMNIPGCDTTTITEKSLKEANIPYDALSTGVKDKLTFFKENDLELIIEDSFETCQELVANGFKAILMTTRMNQNIDSGDIPRVNSWKEIYELLKK